MRITHHYVDCEQNIEAFYFYRTRRYEWWRNSISKRSSKYDATRHEARNRQARKTHCKSCNTPTRRLLRKWVTENFIQRCRGDDARDQRFEKFNSSLTLLDISQHSGRYHVTLLKQTSECFMKETLQYWFFGEKQISVLQFRNRKRKYDHFFALFLFFCLFFY